MSSLSFLDFFSKSDDDTLRRSSLSGLISVVCYVVIGVLLWSEVQQYAFAAPDVENVVAVDTRRLVGKLSVLFDVDFPGLACHEFGVDAVDTAGELQLELSHDLSKEKLAHTHLGDSDGCRVRGTLHINRVKGEFHIAFGRQALAVSGEASLARSHVHRFTMAELDTFNCSHRINELRFGDAYPGVHNPLDGVRKTIAEGSMRYIYFLKVVPTEYHYLNGTVLHTNQFAYTQHEIPVNTHASQFWQPGVYFKYEIEPYVVRRRELPKRLLTFVTSLCALIGGAFVVGGLISSTLTTLFSESHGSLFKRGKLVNA
jgi:endoplasmic reticulum-Golgi intermediate compartment protein 1